MEQRDIRQNLPRHVLTYHTKTRLTGVETRLFLRESPERFLNWLLSHLDDVCGHLFLGNYDAQYITLEPGQPQSTANGDFVLAMTGTFQDYSGSQIPIGFEPVRIDLRKGIGEQTVVIIHLWNFRDLVESFLDSLLTAIVERWSEAKDLMEVRTLQIGPVDDDTWSMWADITEGLRAKLGAFPRPGIKSTVATPRDMASATLPTSATDYNLGAMRDLLEEAFTEKTLRRFFQDRPIFRDLVDRFSAADGLADLVDEVVDYCRQFLLWDELLAEVKKFNPRQYTRFEGQLASGTETSQTLSPPAATPTTEKSGTTYVTHIQQAQGLAIGDGARVVISPQRNDVDDPEGKGN